MILFLKLIFLRKMRSEKSREGPEKYNSNAVQSRSAGFKPTGQRVDNVIGVPRLPRRSETLQNERRPHPYAHALSANKTIKK